MATLLRPVPTRDNHPLVATLRADLEQCLFLHAETRRKLKELRRDFWWAVALAFLTGAMLGVLGATTWGAT